MEHKDAIYWLNNLIGNYSDYYDEALEMGVEALEQQEKAQLTALPSTESKIIRCKDCVYRATDIDGELYCRKSTCDIDENDFCSWAKKENR